MINLLLSNKIDIVISIGLVIISIYLLKKFLVRQFIEIKKNNVTNINHDNDDDDDYLFQFNIDKRSLRPSYARFMRRKLQQELTNDSCLCVICCNDRKNIVLLPCRHLCVCVTCSKQLWNNTQKQTCPICRSQVDNRLEIFV
ncbi:unnamed protein product [Rotaria sp. Silwood1]|nr:unnamed protein product [Rotaria sp. Silwood1]CAF3458032.1 unnamed protein product [Rotaria sp. Silwood1]CAF3499946.1 unnamed protein product [Rotaria sp. Silwood1]CAF3509036.1 unnamed protein product [Rotaria sp. Silwood1]CAF4615564.1 unnamed protein product [Rotaria sp. Silwood1]